jgi:hypothetical protein
MKVLSASIVAVLASVTLTAQLRVPHIPLPKDLPLPGVDRLLHGESPISTTLKDARVEVPFLDHMNVKFGNLATLRNQNGSFTLTPGHWAGDLQTFCFHAGTRGPQRTDGQGYLSGPITGPDSAVFIEMLSKYSTLRDVDQHDMQVLIWALLARTKIHNMEPRLQALAARVLTPAQIAAVESGALDVVPPALRERAFSALPADLRRIAEAENRIRELLYRANYTYAELESAAVLQGPEPRANREVPRQRWSIHPGGYLVRYHPSHYSRTTVEIAVPPKYTIQRDGKGRIRSIEWSDGRRTETEYDDTIPAFDPAPNVRAIAYAFKSVKLSRPGANGRREETVIANKGWTFVTKRSALQPPRFGFQLASFMQNPLERILDWKQRYDDFNETYTERLEWYRDRYEHMTSPPPSVEDTIRDLEDMQHYRDAIEAILTGGELGWLVEHQERMNAALERATLVIASLPDGSEDSEPRGYRPPMDIAIPAHPSSQRLGMSGRFF